MGVSINGVSQNEWFITENPINIWFGEVPPFWETSIWCQSTSKPPMWIQAILAGATSPEVTRNRGICAVTALPSVWHPGWEVKFPLSPVASSIIFIFLGTPQPTTTIWQVARLDPDSLGVLLSTSARHSEDVRKSLWDPVINFRLSQKICRSSMIQYLGAVFFAPLSRIRNRSPTSPCFSWAGRSADQGSHFRMSESVEYCIGFVLKIKHGSGMQWKIPLGFSYFNAHLVDFQLWSWWHWYALHFWVAPRAVQESWDAESQTGRKLREIRGWYRSGDESFWVNQLVNCPTKVNR